DVSPLGNGLLRLLFVYLIAVQPGPDFGQREHLLVLLASPFLLMAASKMDGVHIERGPSMAGAVMLALGFALKPHFLAVMAGLAVVAFVINGAVVKTLWREALAVIFVLAGYGISVLIFFPAYIDTVIPVAVRFYLSFSDWPRVMTVLALSPALLVFLCLVGPFALFKRELFEKFSDSRVKLLFAAAVMSVIVFAAQRRGYPYQFVPAMTWGYLSMGMVFFRICLARPHDLFTSSVRGRALVSAAVAVPLMVMSPVGSVLSAPTLDGFKGRVLTSYLGGNYRGKPVLILSTRFSQLPLFLYAGLTWTSRFPQTFPSWLLPALEGGPGTDGGAGGYVSDAVAEDFERHAPDLVLVEKSDEGVLLDLFLGDPRARELWRSYDNYYEGRRFSFFARHGVVLVPPGPEL
ncbi:MAG: hypothetical protein V3R66_07030, partial [Rhodospirillales bacterium]